MGLWSEGVKRSRGVGAAKKQYSKTTKKEIDREERHFQICLALMTRADLDSSNPEAIILQADKMIEALKKHAATAE